MILLVETKRLREVLNYDSETGVFTYTGVTPGRAKGDIAGCMDKSTGYRVIRIDRVLYYAHRLAWQYVTGEVPDLEIDHKNLKKEDNWFDNLRKATRSQNERNKPAPSNNTSGAKGVSFCRTKQRWRAFITHEGKMSSLGYFVDKGDAIMARNRASERMHGDFCRQ